MNTLPSGPHPETPLVPKKKSGVWIAIIVFVAAVVVTPVFLLAVMFPWLSQQAFTSVTELKPEEVEEIRVQLLNHPERKPDVGPIALNPEQVEPILVLLRSAEKITEIPASATLGELRVRYKDGRRGTIRLRFQPARSSVEDAPVWMEIGSQKYQAGTLGPLWLAAENAAAAAGSPPPR